VKQLLAPPERPKSDRRKSEARIKQLAANIEKARSNLALLDPENIPAAQNRIREMDGERKAIEEELRQTAPIPEREINEAVRSVLAQLYDLANWCRAVANPKLSDLDANAPPAVRRLLRGTSQIVVHTKKTGEGTGTRHEFLRGEITFRVGVNTTRVNLHDRAS